MEDSRARIWVKHDYLKVDEITLSKSFPFSLSNWLAVAYAPKKGFRISWAILAVNLPSEGKFSFA